jgi:hypothetical protein
VSPVLALFGGYGLKGGNLLSYLGAVAVRALEFLLLIFGKCERERKGLFALLAHKIIYRHTRLLYV